MVTLTQVNDHYLYIHATHRTQVVGSYECLGAHPMFNMHANFMNKECKLQMHGVLGHVCFPTRSKKITKKTSTTKAITFVLFIVELSILEHMKRSWHQSCSPILSKKSKICFIPCWVCFCCACLFLCFFLPGGGNSLIDILTIPSSP